MTAADAESAAGSGSLDRRVPEPELMDEPEQARAYSEADFAEAHQRFADLFGERHPQLIAGPPFSVLDLGCGPADATARFARAYPQASVVGVDGAAEMLALGQRRLVELGLTDRVRLEQVRLPDPSWTHAPFDAVISNSLLHHLDDPVVLWRTVQAHLRPGGAVLVMDLRRPPDLAAVDELVAREAADAPAVLRHDLRASLCAAYRPDEVASQLAAQGLDLSVEPLGDRHLLVVGRL